MPKNNFPKRPPRLETVFPKHPIYLITCCSSNRKKLFSCSNVMNTFLRSCVKCEDVGNMVGPYVLMPDHIHFFISIGPQGNLGKSVRFLKSEITKMIRVDRSGVVVWQSGFFDHLIRNEQSFYEKWEYIEENPVRAGLVSQYEDWPWRGVHCRLRW